MLSFMFARYAAENGLDVETASAGVKGGGSPVNPYAAQALAERGICGEAVENFRSSVFDETLARQSDIVFTMTEAQKDFVKTEFPRVAAECLSSLCGKEIDDPYGKGAEAYRETAAVFDGLLEKIAERVRACGNADGGSGAETSPR